MFQSEKVNFKPVLKKNLKQGNLQKSLKHGDAPETLYF